MNKTKLLKNLTKKYNDTFELYQVDQSEIHFNKMMSISDIVLKLFDFH